MRRLKYPNTTGIVARNELKDLKLTTMVTFWEIVGKMGLVAGRDYRYDQQMSIVKWFNGSTTIMMEINHRPSDPEYNYLGSYLCADAFIDEGAGVPGMGIEVLKSRIRENIVNGVPKLLITCNPSKGYLYNNFFKPSREGRLDPVYDFIPALLSDNTNMQDRDSYQQTLEGMSERNKRRLLYGDWDYDDAPDLLFETHSMLQMFTTSVEAVGQSYITCDPAAMGSDRTVIGIWKGLHLLSIHEFRSKYPHEVADILRKMAMERSIQLSNVVVDADGLGIGIAGLLKCREFLNGSSAKDKEHFANIKAECYFKLSEYVASNKVFIHPTDNREDIMKELDLVRDRTKEDKKKAVSNKEEIKAALGYSPDYADMLMMRMYFELNPNAGRYSFI